MRASARVCATSLVVSGDGSASLHTLVHTLQALAVASRSRDTADKVKSRLLRADLYLSDRRFDDALDEVQ